MRIPPNGPTNNTTRQDELFRLLIDSIHDYAVFMLEPDGRVATWNAGAERLKGYRASEIIGKPFSVFYPDRDVQAGKCEMELATATAQGRFEDEGWRIRKDGTRFWANVVISAIRDPTNTLLGFSKVTRDLTERKRAEEERAALLAAEQASRAKDEFMAMLGHELRNPLAPIVTALQLMKLRDGGKRSKEEQIIERQVNHMVRLVDDLLDVSRIARGNITLKREALDVHEIMAKAIETASPLLEDRRQHLQVEAGDSPMIVRADSARLVQVFANLLTNAAKYTQPSGHIRINMSECDGVVAIEVSDDGIGIANELLPQIFELFVQAPQGIERSRGGLGIGLALVKRLLALHGGTVEAHSAGLGLGSTFTVRLPSSHAKPAMEPAVVPMVRPPGAPKKRVLIVDDNPDALTLIGDALARFGFEVRTAPDGLVALQLAIAFEPHVAIIDIGLPVLDGYELASRIRTELGNAAPRMIALTGYGQQNDRMRSIRAGFEQHLVKPVELSELIASVQSVQDPPDSHPPGSADSIVAG